MADENQTALPGDDQSELKPQCAATFAAIETTIRMVNTEIRGLRDDVQEMGRSQSSLDTSTKGLWHEIRDELRPDVKELPDRIAGAVNGHATDCPARRRAMKRAESDGDSGVRELRDEISQVVDVGRKGLIRNNGNGHYEIPRPVLWVGGLIGAAVAASGYVIHLLSSM